jgi:hypothetical protein
MLERILSLSLVRGRHEIGQEFEEHIFIEILYVVAGIERHSAGIMQSALRRYNGFSFFSPSSPCEVLICFSLLCCPVGASALQANR